MEMRNAPRDLFLSQRLFWDQRRHEIYSDTFVHIENADHVLEGTGFVSNEQLTVYRVLRRCDGPVIPGFRCSLGLASLLAQGSDVVDGPSEGQ